VSLSTTGERFWSKVDKGPECWLWTASTFKSGRGQFKVAARNRQAHLVAWELSLRAPPLGLLRSRCGNLRCVRPDHQVVLERMGTARNLARTADRRFEDMVSAGPDCWLWTGSVTRFGYGQFGVMVAPGLRRMIPAHRFAWEQAWGAIPERVDVLHLCGNRNCVRPDHLTLRDPVETSRFPTSRQLQIFRVWVGGSRHEMEVADADWRGAGVTPPERREAPVPATQASWCTQHARRRPVARCSHVGMEGSGARLSLVWHGLTRRLTWTVPREAKWRSRRPDALIETAPEDCRWGSGVTGHRQLHS
jgi:HNH endonuclease